MPDREKLIELLSQVQYLGGLEEKIADHLIANGVTVQQWIPVTKRLPEDEEEVLVTDGGSAEMCTYFSRSGWCNEIWCIPSHWMPLPEPPKEG